MTRALVGRGTISVVRLAILFANGIARVSRFQGITRVTGAKVWLCAFPVDTIYVATGYANCLCIVAFCVTDVTRTYVEV